MWYTSMSMNSGRHITYTNTPNSHSNPVSWELWLFSITDKKIRMHKVLMEMLRGCGVNLQVWMILEKKKKQNGKLGWVEGTETECDIWDKHYQ